MAGGSELGSAHVSIFPQMKGFRQNVAKETGKAVSDLKNAFSKGFNGAQQGKQAGNAFKNGFNSGAAELNSEALKSFKKDVAQASQKNTDALLKFKSAGVQVQAAQEKLNAATQKYGADSTQAQAAAIKLEQAQIRQKAAADNLKAATDNLKTAKGRLKDLETQLAAEADKSRNVFVRMASGFVSVGRQVAGTIPGVNSAMRKISSTAGEVTSNIKSKFSAVWNALPEGARNAATKAGSALHSGLSKASGFASKAVSGIGNAARGMATVVSGAATAAAAYLVNFGRQSVDAALKAEEVTAKFQQVAKNNNWADEEQKSLLGLNKTLGQTGVVSAGTLKAAQAQLGTFALTADQVKTLTPALADMIANNKGYNATAQDGVQIANLLGKVMTGSATALSKYGVTMTDAQKKVLQEGSASEKAAMAAQVLEANFGGINKALAQTPQGKMTILQHEIAGLKTSVGNDLIAAFGGVGGAVIKMVQAVEPLITALFDKVASLAEKIGPPLEKVFGAVADKIGKIDFSGLSNSLGSLSGPIAAVTGLLGAAGLGGALSGLSGVPVIGGLLSKFGGVLSGLGGPITLVIGALAGLIATSPQLRSEFGEMLKNVLASLQQAFQMLQPSIQALMTALGQLTAAVMPVITNVIGQIIPLLTPIISTLVGVLVPVIQGVLTVVTSVITAITPAIQGIQPIVITMINEVMAVIQALMPVIQALAPLVSTIISAIVGFINSTLLPTIQAMLPFIQGVINGIAMVVNGIVNVIQGVINLVTGLIHGNWQQAWNGFSQIVHGVVQGVLGFLGGVGSAIMGVFAGAGTWLWNAGASIINGLLDGLKAAFGKVKSFVSGIGDWIVQHKGPLSYDKVMLKPAGQAIMQGFDKSLKAGWKDVQRTVNGMNAQINGGFDVDASKSGRANVSNGGAGATYVTQTFNYPAIAPTSISTQQRLQTAAMPQW
jgi:phage-related protein|uniref:Minor tail protein n=1 Tax=Siphoviridae sp. ctfdk3 TaxID=2826416 RepID=A0A8S5NKK9_9CAUD|nr:MAG TPA: minor tail protein [Siphoviridae sp. ctfdk3]DAZ05348.1 MAG TPA: minor tail protein [Caudoviricetes sp.]